MKTELYRHFDCDGKLLYVGISKSTRGRFAEHLRQSNWAHIVATITIERFDHRFDAEEAEKKAIQSEHPRFNKVFSTAPKHNRKKKMIPAWIDTSDYFELQRISKEKGVSIHALLRAEALKFIQQFKAQLATA